MITTVGREELVRLGKKYRAAYLNQQAGYTLGTAAGEEAAIEAILEDPQLLEDVGAAQAQVAAAMKDKDLVAAESQSLTTGQNEKLREAKVWRRKAAKRAARARRQGKIAVPEELATVGRATSVPDVLASMNTMLGMMEAHAALLGAGASPLMEEGRRLYTQLGTADATQEQAVLAALPAKVVDFYAAKGLLYLGLKVIHDAGHELHAASPELAARYNLRILYRTAGRTPKKPVVGDGPLG